MTATVPRSSRSADVRGADTEERLMRAFSRAAATVPAYRTLLAEHGVRPEAVRDGDTFVELCPILSKKNTFERFTIDELSAGGSLGDVAEVLTSSGHGGVFSFGVVSRDDAANGAEFIDRALDAAFGVLERKTLTINCLAMGVGFGSRRMTVATTSVREDMALALAERFGHHYEQIVLVGDPLFLKKLTDYARERGFDWSRHRVNVVVGEEIFGERFRGYLASCLALNTARPDGGYVMASFGVGELGLHLCYETPATIGLRRAMLGNPAFARELTGSNAETGPLPMIFGFDPQRTFIEALDPDRAGYGRMTISMLDASRTVPLLRYQTGDVARLLDRAEVESCVRRHGIARHGALPAALLALRGRDKDDLPNGSHVGVYKDALYADHRAARYLTGAVRMTFPAGRSEMHVQLGPAQPAQGFIAPAILRALPSDVRPDRVVVWPYREFPYGMSLDYERKFCPFVPGERDR
jgi:phenylacetate-coenzyme A ligase PaaK-like adenylate-forming protein